MSSIFRIVSVDDNKLEEYRTKAMRELNEFFGKKWIYHTPKIILADDRNTINLLRENETPDWLVGWSWGRNAIFILNPDNFSKESSHIYTEEKIEKLVKHELCHCFLSSNFLTSHFEWVNEGICVYTSNQSYMSKMPKTFEGFLDGNNIYTESGNAIKILIDNFGKEKLFDFLKKQSEVKEFNELNAVFKKIYNADLTYEFFNKNLRNI